MKTTHIHIHYFSGKIRDKVAAELSNNKTINVVNNQKRHLMINGSNDMPAHAYDKKVLNKIVSERRKNPGLLDFIYNKYCIDTKLVRVMQIFPEIKVIFWHEYQCNFYKYYAKRNYTILSLDDTGGIVSNVHDTRKHSSNLFQLQILTKEGPSLPIGQLLSDRKHCEVVKEFLKEWLKNFKWAPREMVMDGAAALHNAACEIFNKCTLARYKKGCWNFIIQGTDLFPFKTLIRMDRNHTVHTIVRWGKKKIHDRSVRYFVIRSICLCIDLVVMENIVKVLITILFVVLQKKESEMTLKCKEALVNFVRSGTFEDLLDFGIEISPNWYEDNLNAIQKITDVGKVYSTPNAYHNLKIATYLKYLTNNVLLWTAVVAQKAQSEKIEASSANIESYFSNLKTNILLKQVLPIDEFLQKFVEYVEGEISFRPGEIFIFLIQSTLSK